MNDLKLFKYYYYNIFINMILFLFSFFITTFSFNIPISSILNKKFPHKINVLENDLVIWWDHTKNEWSAIDDMCLHRQASLSNGVITNNGDIKCGYHGLEFGSCGSCKFVPSSSVNTISSITKSYRIIERHNFLWLDLGINHPIDNIITNHVMMNNWFYRTVDIPHHLWIENFMDSLHLEHTHHNTPPPLNRYKPQDNYFKNQTILHWYNSSGFSFQVDKIVYNFYAPYTVIFNYDNKTTVCANAIPIGLNKTAFISNSFVPYSNNKQKKILTFIFKLTRPLLNFLGNRIWIQDYQQLLGQYNNQKKNPKKYLKFYTADEPIHIYLKWLNEFK